MKAEEISLSPRSVIYSYKSLGYSFKTALADIVDNSISASAKVVNVIIDNNQSSVYIIDDGKGMDLKELLVAMTPGGKDPTLRREEHDLGRFGLGLKSASFSQCNNLKVVTKSESGEFLSRTWDIDYVLDNNRWQLFEDQISDYEKSLIPGTGTIVKWSNFSKKSKSGETSEFERAVHNASEYCRLVFHKYLEKKLIEIHFNSTPLQPFDPFFTKSEQINRLPSEEHSFGTIQGIILDIPRGKVHKKDKENYDLVEGFNLSQGVYVYRKDRLIFYGGWFNLFPINELYRLGRVEVNYENFKDENWSLDVVKSKAIPPKGTQDIFKRIFEKVINDSKLAFRERGRKVTKSNPFRKQRVSEIWNSSKEKDSDKFVYRINRKNEFILDMIERYSLDRKAVFELFRIIEEFIPLEKIVENNSSDPSGHVRSEFSTDKAVFNHAENYMEMMKSSGKSEYEIREFFTNTAPFSYFPEIIGGLNE